MDFLFLLNLKKKTDKNTRGQCHRNPLQLYTTQGETLRLTHQQHQHEHFRLSHSTPVAVPRGHDAVATSGYACAVGFPGILEHGARLAGKCSYLGNIR